MLKLQSFEWTDNWERCNQNECSLLPENYHCCSFQNVNIQTHCIWKSYHGNCVRFTSIYTTIFLYKTFQRLRWRQRYQFLEKCFLWLEKISCISKSYDNLNDNEIIWIEAFFPVNLLVFSLYFDNQNKTTMNNAIRSYEVMIFDHEIR